jgi:hypothetical protein
MQAQAIAQLMDLLLRVKIKKTHMFSIEASMEESSWALVTSGLLLFERLSIPSSMCANH